MSGPKKIVGIFSTPKTWRERSGTSRMFMRSSAVCCPDEQIITSVDHHDHKMAAKLNLWLGPNIGNMAFFHKFNVKHLYTTVTVLYQLLIT